VSKTAGLEQERPLVSRFTLYGSPHSLPSYKVALMLRLSGQPFSFRYVSFQKGMHKTAEFSALSRWGQVPVLVESGRIYNQSAFGRNARSVSGA
jgi:glutathione S-transferase